MQTNSPYPLAIPALGILDPTVSLLATSTVPVADGLLSEAAHPDPTIRLRTNLPSVEILRLADRLAELYEAIFPNHPEWMTQEVVNWQNEDDVAAAVQRFLKRVNAKFPVYDELWEYDLDSIEWQLHEIPVIAMGYDIWYDEWQEFNEPIPYLLHMGYSRWQEVILNRRDEFSNLYPEHRMPRSLEPHRLVDKLRQRKLLEPLAALPDLIQMLFAETSNIWLDVEELSLAESGGFPQWSLENVTNLTEAWQEAQPVVARVNRLLDWRNESSEAIDLKLTAVRDALLDAYQRIHQLEFKLEVPS